MGRRDVVDNEAHPPQRLCLCARMVADPAPRGQKLLCWGPFQTLPDVSLCLALHLYPSVYKPVIEEVICFPGFWATLVGNFPFIAPGSEVLRTTFWI